MTEESRALNFKFNAPIYSKIQIVRHTFIKSELTKFTIKMPKNIKNPKEVYADLLQKMTHLIGEAEEELIKLRP